MTNNSNTFLLESKLKRLKISFAKVNGKITIGKPKVDYTQLFGLIILPIFLGLAASIFLITSAPEFRESYSGKIFGGIVLFFSIGVINILRILAKMKANKELKILEYKTIIIKTKEVSKRFDANNTKDFEYTIKKVDKETYEGKLFLIDTTSQKHLILGFDDENEQYVTDDLSWFSDYFKKHLQQN
ncbi:hypothetical protein IMCC3317_01880 [Kordia antarctica]|uniref:Uncharacterized protein n=1 Tax=Kordia antarctica TaxID=1218801 RepID=A0A7L4ZDJ6_9FLAO|nr:hypothetical protein [Kordia antarctica]QHI34843.1 hypothetical protein IMCC3317_01880 [Kordia antarctica]